MKHRFTSVIAAVVLAGLGMSCAASAQSGTPLKAPWSEGCSRFQSEGHFVRESSRYCLRQAHQRHCHTQAKDAFMQCGFQADYARLSQRLHAKLLVVWALAGAQKAVNHGDS